MNDVKVAPATAPADSVISQPETPPNPADVLAALEDGPPAHPDALLEEALTSGEPAKEKPTEPAKAQPVTAAAIEDVLEGLLDDSKPWTPERVQESAKTLRAEVQKARELRSKASNLWTQAESKALKFQAHRERALAHERSVQAQGKIFTGAAEALQSGDHRAVIQVLGQLCGRDGFDVLRDLNLTVAAEGRREPLPREADQRLSRLEQELRAEREDRERARAQYADQSAGEAVERELSRMVTEATTAGPPLVRAWAAEYPEEARAALYRAKESHFKSTGRVLDNAGAFASLEKELRARSELFQRAHSQTGKNGTTSSGLDGERATQTNPSTAQSTPRMATVPGAMSGAPAGARSLTRAEENELIAQQLPSELWRALHMDD